MFDGNLAAAVQGSATATARILADIGGTNARFAYQLGLGSALQHVETLPVAEHASLEQATRTYLSSLQCALGRSFRRPQTAVLAVATAVMGDEVRWTNSPWSFSCSTLQRSLGLDHLTVLNDFEALALSLPYLTDQQIAMPASSAARPTIHASAMLAVVGPGTGLGVAGLRNTGMGWVALPTEGGHATLAPHCELETAVLGLLQKQYAHVSAERVLCGPGLQALHECLLQLRGQSHQAMSAKDIVDTALASPESAAAQTVEVFCAWLGSFCGSVALTLGAREGLFVGGGIVPRLGARFFESEFRARFEAKGRFREYLAGIPTPVITDSYAALTGAGGSK